MSGNRFVFEGLTELKAALRALPAELTEEAGRLVEAAANSATAEIKAAYPVVTGNMRDHIEVTNQATGRFGISMVVRNTARHAWIFENGTEARHYVTRNGVRHVTGRMPPMHVFIPSMIRQRHAMYEALADLLERHGLRVSGTA